MRPQLLLVEDDPFVVKSLERLLGARWDIVAVPDVPSAREMLATRRFAGVIVDVLLDGGADGFEIVEVARRHNHLRPVIVVTGLEGAGLDARAARLGALFATKPPRAADFAAFEDGAKAYAAKLTCA